MWNWSNASRPLLGALVLGSTLMGCVDNTVSLFIRQIQAPTIAGAGCAFTNDPSSPSIPGGILDVAIADSYRVAPLLANQLITNANMDQRRPEGNFLNVKAFVDEPPEGSPDGAPIGPAFSVYQNIVVPPSLPAGIPGYASASIEVIPRQTVAAPRSAVCVINPSFPTSTECPVPRYTSADRRIIVKLTAFGESLGQNGVESTPYLFPVTVTCGGLITFPADSDAVDSLYPGPDCRGGNAIAGIAACSPGQDFPVDCRLCSGSNPFCSPPGFDADPTAGGTCTP